MSAPHPLLQRQVAEAIAARDRLDLERLLRAVSASYDEMDRDRGRADLSIALMVERLGGLTADLERKVRARTAELEEARRRTAATLDSIDQGILMISPDGRVTVFNHRACSLLGLSAEWLATQPLYLEIIAHHLAGGDFEGLPADELATLGAAHAVHEPCRLEWTRANGDVIEMRCFPHDDGGCVRTYADITEARRREQQLAAAEAEYRGLFENAVTGIYRSTPDGRQLRANPALVRLNGYSTEAEMLAAVNDIGREWYVDLQRRDQFKRAIERDGRVDDFVSEIYRHRTRERLWISETAWRVCDSEGRTLYYEGTVIDCTARMLAEAKLADLAHKDMLTGAFTRAAFLSALETRLVARRPLAVLCIDLDHFKEVNDALGHSAGDELLRAAVRRFHEIVGGRGVVARLGGDEFAVMLDGVADAQASQLIGARIIEAMGMPFEIGGATLHIGASVGVALSPLDSDKADELMRFADTALYRAKAAGRSSLRHFDLTMAWESNRRRSLEADLRGAAARNELEVYLQPIVEVISGDVRGYEALMRWRHPEKGLLTPDTFIPIAEETALIVPLGEWMLLAACRAIAACPEPIQISVNLSPMQFRARSVVEAVRNALGASGLAPDRLILEITETVLLVDDAYTTAALRELRGLGVQVALDDFGAGYSSLSYLQKFRFDVIKIDRAFIASTSGDTVTPVLLRTMLNLGRELGAAVVAEGVETEEQRAGLRRNGAELAQGFLFGGPRPAGEYISTHATADAIRNVA
jgi:diguanylate cyclase (GGDEF)-like protein/PAS domain S-box-containing protein